jgi:hypothetical protein
MIATIKTKAWATTCALILPLTTNCKVCNFLRGGAIGLCLGVIATLALKG